MRLITWNINSLRLRLPSLSRLTQEQSPDIICLQETKVQDADFPMLDVQSLGYPYVERTGEKSYNGVAILSRIPLTPLPTLKLAGSSDCRHIAAALPNGVEVHNFYVPAGGDEPDITINPKFAFKLNFVDAMHDWFKENRTSQDKMILVGDLNIAPLEHDVWSHKQLLKIVSHTPVEVEKMTRLQQGLGWVDAHRHFTPETEKLYSWWSYRNRDWRSSNRGRRLDHIWVTPALQEQMKQAFIMKDVRDWEQPSDHVPAVVDFESA